MSQLIFCTLYLGICFPIFVARTLWIGLKFVFSSMFKFQLQYYIETTKGKKIPAIHCWMGDKAVACALSGGNVTEISGVLSTKCFILCWTKQRLFVCLTGHRAPHVRHSYDRGSRTLKRFSYWWQTYCSVSPFACLLQSPTGLKINKTLMPVSQPWGTLFCPHGVYVCPGSGIFKFLRW